MLDDMGNTCHAGVMVVGVTMIVGMFMNCLFCCRLCHFMGMMVAMVMVVICMVVMVLMIVMMLVIVMMLMPLQIDIHALLFLPVDRHLHMCSCDSALY